MELYKAQWNEPDKRIFPVRILFVFWVTQSDFDGVADRRRFGETTSFEVPKLVAKNFEFVNVAESNIVVGEISAHGPAVPWREREREREREN